MEDVTFKEFKRYCVSKRWVNTAANRALCPAKRTKPFCKKRRRTTNHRKQIVAKCLTTTTIGS